MPDHLVCQRALLILLCALSGFASAPTSGRAADYWVSPAGDPGNAGTAESPLDLTEALRRASRELAAADPSISPTRVLLIAGRYPLRDGVRLGSEFSGTGQFPFEFGGAPGQRVVFDGSVQIPVTAFEPVQDTSERARLAVRTADRIRVISITDDRVHRQLKSKLLSTLLIDGVPCLPSRFPNQGHARLETLTVEPEACPPGIAVGQQAYGRRAGNHPYLEPGRKPGWRGSIDEPRGAMVSFATRMNEMAGSWEQWQQELSGNNRRNCITGYLEANWLHSSQPIVSASAQRKAIQLAKVLSYGWAWRKDKPFRIFGLLCEVDDPGEWHYDTETRRLFICPFSHPGPSTADHGTIRSVSIPVAYGGFEIKNAAHVQVHGIHVTNLADGVGLSIVGGHDNVFQGCSVGSSTARGVLITGRRNGVTSSDFVDLNSHASLGGGKRSATEIVAGANFIENCHFYQRRFSHQRVSVGIHGVGNRFRNNLIHRSIGQAVVVSGNDHLIELNELFNIGYEEGDGGAIYSGADLAGYGTTYRYNFFHHLMHVPGKVGRAGLHLDDLQAGATCVGNVFFKSAEKGIFMFGGSGHTLRDNVFLEGHLGIENRPAGATKHYQSELAHAKNEIPGFEGSKEDYVGRAERVVGSNGWNRPPWSTRYPTFTEVMNDAGEFGRLWPIRCVVQNNFYGMNTGSNRTEWRRMPPAVRQKSSIGEDRGVAAEHFIDYATLDLRPRPDSPLPKIPFGQIGLYLDTHRAEMPSKAHYRGAVKAYFANERSMPGTKRQIDTAKIVEEGPKTRRN